MEGWIKLSRCLIDKPIFQNEKLLKIWIWCLLKATHTGYEQLVGLQKIWLEPGQFIFGRKKAAEELSIAESTVWRLMQFLADKNNPSLEIATSSKFSIITIVNWAGYQVEKTDKCETNNDKVLGAMSEQQMNNKWTANEQQMDTNKNVKNVKNDKEKYIADFTTNSDLLITIKSFVEMRKALKKPMTDNAVKLMLNKLNKLAIDDETKIEILNQSILSSWTDIYPLKQQKLFNNQTPKQSKREQDLNDLGRILNDYDRGNVQKNNRPMLR